MKAGRPSKYSDELAEEIFGHIAEGKSLRQIARLEGMPGKATILRWMGEREGFQDYYAREREIAAASIAEGIIEIADGLEEDPRARAVRISARQWWAAKLAPKKYGPKVDVQHDGGIILRVVIGGEDQRAA